MKYTIQWRVFTHLTYFVHHSENINFQAEKVYIFEPLLDSLITVWFSNSNYILQVVEEAILKNYSPFTLESVLSTN